MLDDLEGIRKIDESDMLGVISRFSKLVEAGYKSAKNLDYRFDELRGGIRFLGLGGSAIGGDLIRDWIGKHIPGGIRVERGYDISSPIDSNSLVICCSYSGNTVETLSMLNQILKSKSKNVIIITSNGELSKTAKKKSLPLIKLEKGMPPRTSLPEVVSAVSVITDQLKWTKKASSEILAASDSCGSFLKRNLAANVPESKNIAKQLAHQMHGFIPIVIAPYNMESVARRWKTQMNENAKQHCFFGTFPELTHNEIVPWQRDSRSEMLLALLLKSNERNVLLSERFKKFRETLSSSAKSIEIEPVGRGRIEMLMSHVLMADYTSAYSAILSKIDPTPVDEIVRFKSNK